jgi:hypothetical protein
MGYPRGKTREEDLKKPKPVKKKGREAEEEKTCPTRKTTVHIGSFRA